MVSLYKSLNSRLPLALLMVNRIGVNKLSQLPSAYVLEGTGHRVPETSRTKVFWRKCAA